MHNRYTIELGEFNGQVKALLYANRYAVGAVWCPTNMLKTKEDFQNLLISVAGVIYGQEAACSEEEESYDTTIVPFTPEDYS